MRRLSSGAGARAVNVLSGRMEYTRLTVLRVAVKAALAGTGLSAAGRERKTRQGDHFKKNSHKQEYTA